VGQSSRLICPSGFLVYPVSEYICKKVTQQRKAFCQHCFKLCIFAIKHTLNCPFQASIHYTFYEFSTVSSCVHLLLSRNVTWTKKLNRTFERPWSVILHRFMGATLKGNFDELFLRATVPCKDEPHKIHIRYGSDVVGSCGRIQFTSCSCRLAQTVLALFLDELAKHGRFTDSSWCRPVSDFHQCVPCF